MQLTYPLDEGENCACYVAQGVEDLYQYDPSTIPHEDQDQRQSSTGIEI